MEYESKDALLYDFVYLSVDTKVRNRTRETERFFSTYAKKAGRNGKYLLNSDMVQPLFEAQYNSPSEMQTPFEKAKIQLMYKRIHEVNFDRTTLNELILTLPRYYHSSTLIKNLATRMGIPLAFLTDGNAASMSAELINYCIDTHRIEGLIDRMIVEYPDIFLK